LPPARLKLGLCCFKRGHAIFAGGHKFDAETRRIMEMAFDMALVAPRLADRADVANEVELILRTPLNLPFLLVHELKTPAALGPVLLVHHLGFELGSLAHRPLARVVAGGLVNSRVCPLN
jgi:hypothetical protein